jgi:hypothetical protein
MLTLQIESTFVEPYPVASFPIHGLLRMQILAWIVAVVAYLDIAALAWAVQGMSKCQAREGCLFYIGYFWIATVAGLIVLLLGSALYVFSKARSQIDRSLPIALSALLAFSLCLAMFMATHTPA